MKTLKDLFLDELADIYDAERQTVEALPMMANAATCDKLRKAIEIHLKETEGHVVKVERVFQYFGEEPEGKTCEATSGLLVEADELAAGVRRVSHRHQRRIDFGRAESRAL